MESKGSGYASYDMLIDEHTEAHTVPIYDFTNSKLSLYGKVVRDYDETDVIIQKWRSNGSRPVMKNTGDQGGIAEGVFTFEWREDRCYAKNEAVGGDYTVGVKVSDYIYTREANYHPDGGQIIYPKNKEPFLLLTANPTIRSRYYNDVEPDDIELDDFVAFLFDGSCGFQIYPYVWHQPSFPLVERMVQYNKQGKVHACVGVDTLTEFNTFLRLPVSLHTF